MLIISLKKNLYLTADYQNNLAVYIISVFFGKVKRNFYFIRIFLKLIYMRR